MKPHGLSRCCSRLVALMIFPIFVAAQKSESPYVGQSYPTTVYWGGTHLHTSHSVDAYSFGDRISPEDAYRFARGEAVSASNGMRARLRRPLDFVVVADHAESMDMMEGMQQADSVLVQTEAGKRLSRVMKGVARKKPTDLEALAAFRTVARKIVFSGKRPEKEEMFTRSVWKKVGSAADRFNFPRRFTAFIGYEWSSSGRTRGNLHRIVLFKDGAQKTDQVRPFSSFDSRDAIDSDPQTIVVDRDKLLTFVQYRSRAFDAARFNALLNSLPKEELQRLIQDYVREEALYREAKALQLDKNDYVARLRLIQQLEFITRGFADSQVQLTPQATERYYEAHQSEYRVAPKVTFTHVFFSSERRAAAQARALARATLHQLNQNRVRFEQAAVHGERFLYQLNYVNRESEEIASHFGAQMQSQLFALQPSDRTWRGPFQSPYGFHLVLLTRSEAGYLPPLEEVRGKVEQDIRQGAQEARFEQAMQSVVKGYKVQLEPIQKASS